jgi:hypothetical protein
MAIDQEVKEAIYAFEQTRVSDQEFLRLRAFYEEMKRRGIAVKKPYDIAPLDTIGRSFYETKRD